MGKTLLNKLKIGFTLTLIILGLLCTSLFFLTACSQDSTTEDDPTYSYSDSDDGLISNPNFSFGTADTALKNFPQTSPTGWSRSKDNTGKSSSAKSGVIDVSDDGWKELLNSIYTDSYYLNYLEKELDFTKEEVKEANSDFTDDELKQHIIETYLSQIPNPKVKDDATDNKIYMLNNYTSDLGLGASQKITSSKSITIEKGEYVKISVSLLTQKISDAIGMSGANKDFGASIRLTNTLNGSSQAEYAITNINTDGAWKTYTLYVKGDAQFSSVVTLALGLGYNSEYQTEGTVYFDDIIVEEIDDVKNVPTTFQAQSSLVYGETKAIIVDANNVDATVPYLYDMTLSVDSNYYKDITPTISSDFTKNSDGVSSNDKGWASSITPSTKTENGTTINVYELKDASASITIEDADFKVSRESYTYVSFKLNNKLSELGSTSITVDVEETTLAFAGNANTTANKGIATITTLDESTVGIMIKNNFDEDDTKYDTEYERTFKIILTVGPTNISSNNKPSNFASGTVEISDFKVATGKTYQYVKDANGDATDEEFETYKFYQLFNGVANGSTSLYKGYGSDFTAEVDESTASTGFSISATHKEYLNKQPVAPKEYDGVVSDHIYLKAESTNSKLNERLSGTSDVSFAGVIDTQYISSYTNTYLKTALQNSTLLQGEEKVRPLMIYNKDLDSYGFIGNTDAKVISVNSYAKISVKVKVDDTAKAYIYLVDTSSKDVMTFNTFEPNTDGLYKLENQPTKGGDKFQFVVDKNTETSSDGWVNVEFYIATGNTEKSFRLELWNGSRDGEEKSQGYVFFKDVSVSLSGGFTEPASFKDSFIGQSSPLANAGQGSFTDAENNPTYLCYSRPLTETEIDFNKDYPESAISYSPKIVWAKNDTMLYAIYNNLDFDETDPYDSITEENGEETGSGCAAQTDPATFWLSFSSILLAVVLILAILTLFVKRFRRNRKANASDAKSHYTVKSRVRKPSKPAKVKNLETTDDEDEVIETEEEIAEVEETTETEIEQVLEPETVETQTNQESSDDYVYGDVQDFGDDNDKN